MNKFVDSRGRSPSRCGKIARQGEGSFPVARERFCANLCRAMYVGFYNFYPHYNANRMFTDPSSPIGDDLMYPFVYTGKRLRELGHKVATLDTDDLNKFDAAVFLDHPTFLNRYFRALRSMPGKKVYLFLFENP